MYYINCYLYMYYVNIINDNWTFYKSEGGAICTLHQRSDCVLVYSNDL